MSNPRITLEITTENGTFRRGFIGRGCVNSAKFWATGKTRNAQNAAVRVVEATVEAVTFLDFLPVQAEQGPESPEDLEDDRCEPPTCPMCDGIHGGRYCPLEDTGWEQSFEPPWAQ